LRFAVATLAVLPFVLFEARKAKEKTIARHAKLYILIGLALFGGAATQQVGEFMRVDGLGRISGHRAEQDQRCCEMEG
ncbi:hypothetical protein AB9E28_36040, partial [Rhizobium leguminosarum]